MSRISHKITWAALKSKAEKLLSSPPGTRSVACGDGLVLRVFSSNTRSRAYWYMRIGYSFVRIGEYPRMSLADARAELAVRIEQSDRPSQTGVGGRLFGELADEWLLSKKRLARYPNIRKCVEYLKPLANVPVRKITNIRAKNALLSQEITPYKLQEVISSLCSIMDLAIEDGIINFEAPQA